MYMNPLSDVSQMNTEDAERLSKNWWLVLLLGIITIIAGMVVLGSNWTLAGIITFFGVLLIIRGIIQVASPEFTGGSKGWNVAIGILSILVGVAVFIVPGKTLLFIALTIGLWFVLTGLFDIAGSISARQEYPYWGLTLVRGLLAVLLGAWMLYRPGMTLLLTIFIFGVWAIAMGVLEIAAAVEIRRLPRLQQGTVTQAGTA